MSTYRLIKLASRFEKQYNIKLANDDFDDAPKRETLLPRVRETIPGLGIDPNPEDRFTEVMGLPFEKEENLLFGESPQRKQKIESNSLAWIKDDQWSGEMPMLKLVYVLQSSPQLSVIEEQQYNPLSGISKRERQVLTSSLRKVDHKQPVFLLNQNLTSPLWHGVPEHIDRNNVYHSRGKTPLYCARKLW